ncbi:MAG: O-antigen ligase domain-containing protein [Pseudolabrys sp.]|nr:O-antigen ligase domain-containing protein [Pseudolabrys sp.]
MPPIYAAPVQAIPAPATGLRERILLVVLYLTVLASSVAVIEPSPHDALMGVLLIACLIAGIRFDRLLAVPFLLLLMWNVAGLMSLMNVPADAKAVQYAATSVYLAVAAMIFALLLTQNTMARIGALRSAYVLTATLAALAGIAGYFSLFPGAHEQFATNDRALGGFKDPNVFGPFLIWPLLIVVERMLLRKITLLGLATTFILLLGLLLSFSRGAWFHFTISAFVMVAVSFITAETPRIRMRLFAMSAISLAALAGLLMVLLSFGAIGEMFMNRAQLIQSYDVGDGGRFKLQELALGAMLKFPNGMGPFEFAAVYGLQQHNVYLQAFLVYGWVGGVSYLMLLFATVWIALRTVFVRTPWQPYMIVSFATFVGVCAEGFVIDTDHWRHFFLLLGLIWGLAAATRHYAGRTSTGQTPYAYAR